MLKNKKGGRPAALKRRSTPSDLQALQAPSDSSASGHDKPDMATSFLQFCATCEKQIMTPCNSILYCSEACRRRDSSKPLSAISPAHTPPSSVPSSPRPALAPRTPTYVRASSTRIPADLHNAKLDLDPTEWKPNLHQRTNSDAYRYLSQFHRSTSAIAELNEERKRPVLNHASTTSITTTPSLTNTPTTTASSWSTNAGYDFNTRPLQPRHNPVYSASASYSKGIDLVTPHVPPPAEIAVSVLAAANVDIWEKKVVLRGNAAGGQDGLSALFGGATSK